MTEKNSLTHILETSYSEEFENNEWKTVLKVVTDIELAPDHPDYSTEKLSILIDTLNGLISNNSVDKASVTQKRTSKPGKFTVSELKL